MNGLSVRIGVFIGMMISLFLLLLGVLFVRFKGVFFVLIFMILMVGVFLSILLCMVLMMVFWMLLVGIVMFVIVCFLRMLRSVLLNMSDYVCIRCGVGLVVGDNWSYTYGKNSKYICRYCYSNDRKLFKKSVYDVSRYDEKKLKASRKLGQFCFRHNINDFVCGVCGSSLNVEKHHFDYDLWNCFIPLCNSHHQMVHKGGLVYD